MIFTSLRAAPNALVSFTAFDLVRLVVPKQGMVTASTFSLLPHTLSAALHATASAKALSKPPDMPTTSVFTCAFFMRVTSPSVCMVRICAHLSSRAPPSSGTKGMAGVCLWVRRVFSAFKSKYTSCPRFATKVLRLRLSAATDCTSASVMTSSAPSNI